jgi:peptidoglycan/LPS O-acetylase OafA/YrhL
VPALDGVRGMAILLVLVFHFAVTSFLTDASLPVRVLKSGWIGVDLFFVLSGFLITGILHDARPSTHYFRTFYMRRTLRIFPLYYGVLALVLLVMPLVRPYHTPIMQGLVRDQAWFWFYGTNIALLWTPGETFGPLLHFWSLAVEEQFYLVWPLVIWALTRRQAIAASVACILGAPVIRALLLVCNVNPFAIYALTPCRFDALAVGAVIALLLREQGAIPLLRRVARWARWTCGFAVAALFVVRAGLSNVDPPVQIIGFSCLAGFFGGVVAGCAAPTRESMLQRVFKGRFLRALGKYSYGLYVFHPLVFGLYLEALAVRLLAGWPSAGIFASVAAIKIGLTFLVAFVSWHVYEAPMMRLRRFFSWAPPARSG